jgi:two-component system phosphate regulon sensor histidine kinase PhoR
MISSAVLDCLPDPVLLLDEGRVILVANQAARAFWGENIINRSLVAVLRAPGILAAVDTVLAKGGEQLVETTLPAPVERVFLARAVALEQAAEPPIRVVLVLSETTLVKKTEQLRADFVANVSHELRSPLSALLGIVETLRGHAANDAQARSRFLEIMHNEAKRMARLIDDLLSLSRIEVNEHVPPSGRVDLRQILGHVVSLLEGQATTRSMSLRLECPQGLAPVVGSGDELTQVFQNLIDNAIKYGREGSLVEIAVASLANMPGGGGPGLTITVRNQGEGIPPQDLPRVTERFYRVDKARSREMGGTGLGLAIVKHIVSRHRGRLSIASQVGLGTSVTIQLPSDAAR